MSLASILSRTQVGLQAPLVRVELHIGRGLPNFTIVGLPAPVVRESRERVRSALTNSGYQFPAGRITVNLAPVELQKQGGRFDLPIALGLLIASGQLEPPKCSLECYGELGLDGQLRPVGGLFLAALNASREGRALIVPAGNVQEVVLSGHTAVLAAHSLRDAASRLSNPDGVSPAPQETQGFVASAGALAFSDVVGQWHAKRALIIAAAGGHSVLMVGPPGSGKSMLAARLPFLLPPLSQTEALEVAAISSVAGAPPDPARWRARPFRAPHHTSSAHAIVGGGSAVRPGEISLAHHGVLFLDELPEFDRRVLESLREPLESGSVTLARADARIELPARFQLVAAMNPCPCGYLGDLIQSCSCTPARIERYRDRISGPLLDRIDIRMHVPRVPAEELSRVAAVGSPEPATGVDAAAMVASARARRIERSGVVSAGLFGEALRRCCVLAPPVEKLLRRGCEQLQLSGRGVSRVLAMSRTIADSARSDSIEPHHLAEAMQLRRSLSPGGLLSQ